MFIDVEMVVFNQLWRSALIFKLIIVTECAQVKVTIIKVNKGELGSIGILLYFFDLNVVIRFIFLNITTKSLFKSILKCPRQKKASNIEFLVILF